MNAIVEILKEVENLSSEGAKFEIQKVVTRGWRARIVGYGGSPIVMPSGKYCVYGATADEAMSNLVAILYG